LILVTLDMDILKRLADEEWNERFVDRTWLCELH